MPAEEGQWIAGVGPFAHRCGRRSRPGGGELVQLKCPRTTCCRRTREDRRSRKAPAIRAVAVHLTTALEGAVVVGEPRGRDLADGWRALTSTELCGERPSQSCRLLLQAERPILIAVVSSFRDCCPRRSRTPRNPEHD